jgi:diguanylate cyclase (GGDEF)-like protein/PAS domain S-box-containing protein
MRSGALLLVDDNELNRDALSRCLALKGHRVTLAGSGVDALAQVENHPFDLVLLDIEMPGMNGLEVLARLRSTRSRTELPVIMVTARSAGEDVVEAFRLGANDYVTKPVDFPVALARIDTLLAYKGAVEDLRVSEERYALALQGSNDGLWDWNLITGEVYRSARWKAMLGYEESEIGSSPDEWFSRVHPDDLADVKRALAVHLASASSFYENDHRILHRNGTFRWVRCRGAAVRDSAGTVTRLAGSLTDITDNKVADALTGLPNRVLFYDLLERAFTRTQRRPDYGFALLVLGLDRFRAVNDSLGHVTADRLLMAIARRLQASLRATDVVSEDGALTLARLGGDEFTVLLDDIKEPSDAVRVAERLRAALQRPFDVEGHQVFTSATVGIAVSTSGYDNSDEILRDAATALHRAQAGSAPYELFDAGMRALAVARLRLQTDLRNAIQSGALTVHYQPIIAVATGRIAAFEALVRWNHPERGMVSPTEFIPAAEEAGMIREIGRIILTESCRQMARWQRQFGRFAPSLMCVNLSGKHFADPHLVTEIEGILQVTNLAGSALKLEITESAFIGDVRAAQQTLRQLRALGIECSIDDFGTGYSSLSYLHQLEVHTLKVDRSFVSRMGPVGHGSEMVRAIVALAHDFGMDAVAEGVETAEQLAQLESLGCEYVQGFYFSQAVDAKSADQLIASQDWLTSVPESAS